MLRKNLFIFSFFVLNCFSEMILTESFYQSSFLKELKKCFQSDKNFKCEELIYKTEQMQLSEFYRGNLKCQTSILGLQTEIIRNIYFERLKDYKSVKTIPFLIKNC